jgi:hypothetical protein
MLCLGALWDECCDCVGESTGQGQLLSHRIGSLTKWCRGRTRAHTHTHTHTHCCYLLSGSLIDLCSPGAALPFRLKLSPHFSQVRYILWEDSSKNTAFVFCLSYMYLRIYFVFLPNSLQQEFLSRQAGWQEACNPSYSGDWGRRITNSRHACAHRMTLMPTWLKIKQIIKLTKQEKERKKAWQRALGGRARFQPCVRP